MNDLHPLSIAEAKKGLKDKKFSSVELTKAYLERIKKLNPTLNAFITVSDEAIESAKQADELIADGEDKSLLGVPLAIKDNFLTKGIRTTAASKVLDDFIPQYDATVVNKLKNAGAVILGKTNMDAWAHGSSGENSDYGSTKNPWNTEYVPGGSSSGSGAAVAADLCVAATGTDTGGSIRTPASFCGMVGLKPTYGRVSRYGVVAMASSFDSIGHLTKTVEDSALILNLTAGQDEMDATTSNRGLPDYQKNLSKPLKGLKIATIREYDERGLDQEVRDAFFEMQTKLGELGADVDEASIPHSEFANACYYIIQPAEVSSNLARYDGIRYGNGRDSFGDEAKRRIMLGTYTLSTGYYDAYYKKAMQVRTLLKKEFGELFEKFDAVVAPVSPTLPWKLGEKVNDPLKMYLSDIFTITVNLVGIPGLALPMGNAKGLPIGMQILGPQFSEETLFQVGHAYEQATEWHKKKPIL